MSTSSAPAVRIANGNVLRPNRYLAVVHDVVERDCLASLCEEAASHRSVRARVPWMRKAGTIGGSRLDAKKSQAHSLYKSPKIRELASHLAGTSVFPLPASDPSRLAYLVYSEAGDHINWHRDVNFYRGKYFTALLCLVNQGSSDGGLSHAVFEAEVEGVTYRLATPPNVLVFMEGHYVRHRLSPIGEGEHRMVLSMTFCTDFSASIVQAIGRRIKDTAFYGVTSLWR